MLKMLKQERNVTPHNRDVGVKGDSHLEKASIPPQDSRVVGTAVFAVRTLKKWLVSCHLHVAQDLSHPFSNVAESFYLHSFSSTPPYMHARAHTHTP